MQMGRMGMTNGFQIPIHNDINKSLRVAGGSLPGQLRTDAGTGKKTGMGNVTGNMFGPECKVTISREGKRLSAQMKAQEPGSVTAAGTERLLLRQQKQDAMNQKEQSDTLGEISGLMREIRSSYAAGEDKDTIADKQDALNRLLDLKAKQEEENEQRVKDAADSIQGTSKEQEEIDRKNADLYLMLKTLEEKDEEDVDGADAGKDTDGTDGESAGDAARDPAAALGATAAERELQVVGMIDGMFGEGYGKLAQADAMMKEVQAELGLAAQSLDRAELSEAERNQLMTEHIERANNMMTSNYGEMMNLRRQGHQQIRDARELELKHIADSPLDGVEKAKQAILQSGAAAALREGSQNMLDDASEDLEERVQEALDQRNDVASATDDEQEQAKALEEERLAEKRAEEELAREDSEKNMKNNPI